MKQVLILMVFLAVYMTMPGQDIDEYAIRDQYIVQLNSGIDGLKFFTTYPDMHIIKCLSKNMNIWLIQSDKQNILATLKTNSSVKVAQYNHSHIVRRSIIPNDSLFNLQWNMLNTSHPGADISATQAWQLNHSNLTQNGDTIVIAVVDGGGIDSSSSGPGITTAGFDTQHPDLNFFINRHEIPHNGIDDDGNGYIDDYNGWNVFTNTDSVFYASDQHPTHVSGIAGARGNNTIGVAGVMWGAKILPVVGASNYESDVVNAYDYVVEMRKLYDRSGGTKGAFIVATNSSFGVGSFGANPANYPIWCAMYDTLGHYGILSAVAVPDDSVNVDIVNDVPTGCPSKWMIAVTNTTNTDALNAAAGYGPTKVDIGAPGTSIMSCFPNGRYGYDAGTSMSSPHLAGAVAAMYANACPSLLQAYFANPDSIALLMESYIFQSVDPLNSLHNITTTGGRLNLYHAFIAEDAYNCNNCSYPASLSQQDLNCYGDSTASITILAGTNSSHYQYLWSNGETTISLTGLGAGFYQVTVTDSSGCQRQLSTVIPPPLPVVIYSITILPIDTNDPGNIIVNASAGLDTLYYAMDSGSYQTGAIFVTNIAGLHHIYIRNQSGCVLDTIVGIYYAGINQLSEINYIDLAPNPVSGVGTLTIRSSAEMNADIALSDMTGRIISAATLQLTGGPQQKQIDMSMLSDGVYFLSLSHEDKKLAEMKVLVVR